MTIFEAYGPYVLGGSSNEDRPPKNPHALLYRDPGEPWRVASRRPAKKWFEGQSGVVLAHRFGIYIFVARWGESRRPVYVGMTRAGKGFIQEATSRATLQWVADGLNNELARQRAQIELYFVTPRNHRTDPNGEKIQDVESYLIAAYHHYGPDLLNRNKRPRAPWSIAGWPHPWVPRAEVEEPRKPGVAVILRRMAR